MKLRTKEILIFSLIFLLLTFPRLAGHQLEGDELEIIVPAQNILIEGYPGVTHLDWLEDSDHRLKQDSSRAWTWHPWLPYYFVAGSFLLLGESTFSARLPFFIFGLLTVFIFYILLERTIKQRNLRLISMILFVTSVTFILHSKWVKYGTICSFFTLLALYFWLEIVEDRGRKSINLTILTLSIVAIFHSNYIVCMGLVLGLLIDYLYRLIKDRSFFRKTLLPFIISGLACVALTLPWILYSFTAKKTWHVFDPVSWFYNFILFFFHSFSLFMPLLFLLIIPFTKARRNKYFVFFSFIIVGHIIAFTLFSEVPTAIRYFLGLIPIFCIFNSYVIEKFWTWKKYFGVIIIILIIFTNILHLVPFIFFKPLVNNYLDTWSNNDCTRNNVIDRVFEPYSYLGQYLRELIFGYYGPYEYVTDEVKKRNNVGSYYSNLAGETWLYFDLGIDFHKTPRNNTALLVLLEEDDSLDYKEKVVVPYGYCSEWQNTPNPVQRSYISPKGEVYMYFMS